MTILSSLLCNLCIPLFKPYLFMYQIEVIQEVVLPGISKLNDSALDKKPGEQTQFSPKKAAEKGKWIWYSLLNLLSPKLMDIVIK